MLSTALAERATAEAAAFALYRVLGYDPPDKIVWVDGPLDLAKRRELSWTELDPGANIIQALNNKLADSNCTFNRTVRDDPLYWRRHRLLNVYGNLWHAVSLLVDEDTSGLRAPNGNRLSGWLHGLRRPCNWRTLGTGSRSQFDALYICSQEHLYARHGLLGGVRAALHELSRLVTNSGWFVPHQKVCWMAERPETVSVDARGRLHAEGGPALCYRDGWQVEAWKGVRTPDGLIENRDRITVSQIDGERNPVLRRCFIELMSPEAYIAQGGARIVARDDVGVLWHKTWPPDTWAAVEVTNGTAEPDGTHKQYFLQVPSEMRTPRQAVAWTYGLTESQYLALQLRT